MQCAAVQEPWPGQQAFVRMQAGHHTEAPWQHKGAGSLHCPGAPRNPTHRPETAGAWCCALVTLCISLLLHLKLTTSSSPVFAALGGG